MDRLLNVRLGRSGYEKTIDAPSPPLTRNRPSFEKVSTFTQELWPGSDLIGGIRDRGKNGSAYTNLEKGKPVRMSADTR